MGILQHWLARHEEVLVQEARVKGASWADIARLLGRSRQAVWERYRAAQSTV
jgi:biotin operon repressor